MTDWHKHSLSQLRDALDSKKVSSVELTHYFLKRINRLDPMLNSFITVTDNIALEQAKAADERITAGKATTLTGIPIAQKDLFCTKGIKTSCASRMLDNFISPYDATVVARFNAAGAVMIGKTNMDEFAMGSSNENSFYGPVKNPWHTDYVPGGSSGGSAAAVAGRLVPGATGTDTGGSIRQPASLCGITGIKPTYGRVSRFGMVAFASSLDQGGPMAASAEDCAHMLTVMAGHDPNDSTSADEPTVDYAAKLSGSVKGLTIGLPKEFFSNDLDPGIGACVQAAIDTLVKAGAKTKEISLPHMHLSMPAYYVIAPAEASSNLARYDGVRFGYRCETPTSLSDLYARSRAEGFGAEVKRRIMVGTYALSAGYYDAYYLKAQKIRHLIKDDFAKAFEEVDIIAGPTSPTTAFKIGEKAADPIAMYLSDIYTIALNLAGLPGLSMPVGLVNDLPVGMQLLGNYFDEATILNAAHTYQQATDWHTQQPNLKENA